ncbi:hypothetical protein C8J57DRAFT_1708386 [Mycena rebaudengoi]|nr:hypothetical protein C8J57DRAFT_1708386 [Mycena rebaudengoi]
MDPSKTTALRTAIDLKEAIEKAPRCLGSIGTCNQVIADWVSVHVDGVDVDGDSEMEDEEEEEEEDRKWDKYISYGSDTGPGDEDVSKPSRDIRALMKQLQKLQAGHIATIATGVLGDKAGQHSLHLTITREGCEFDGDITWRKPSGYWSESREIAERIKGWYNEGAVSGYGDGKTLETKVDLSVRDAREIPEGEFNLNPELLVAIQEQWAASNFSPSNVIAKPYKICLYGPGGKFEQHRDTPETDLVGTFLVGLGDNCRLVSHGEIGDGALCVKGSSGWTTHTAKAGHWAAFYPDVEHFIREIHDGYRAVIAFKLFRAPRSTDEIPADLVFRDKIKDVLVRFPKPFGILLSHRYSTGTTELSGFDAQLHDVAKEMGDAQVKLLPVLIKWNVSHHEYGTPPENPKARTLVYPLTSAHVDAILAFNRERGPWDPIIKKLDVDLKGTGAEWIDELEGKLPFHTYEHGFRDTSTVWAEEIEDGVEHLGNEARPHSEDSIYLSYALVILQK